MNLLQLTQSLVFGALLACVQIASAQALSQPEVHELERARIQKKRLAIEAAHQSKERACYQYFAVNSCLDRARDQKRQGLANLRQQEIALNDARRRRAAEQASQRRMLKSQSLENSVHSTPQPSTTQP